MTATSATYWLSALSVTCPRCSAPPGQSCVSMRRRKFAMPKRALPHDERLAASQADGGSGLQAYPRGCGERLTLDELPQALASARAAASAAAQFSAGEAPPRTCRYCGRFWTWQGASNNDGHAACLVTESFRRALEELWRSSPTMNMQALASMCGTSKATINAWVHGRASTHRGGRRDPNERGG